MNRRSSANNVRIQFLTKSLPPPDPTIASVGNSVRIAFAVGQASCLSIGQNSWQSLYTDCPRFCLIGIRLRVKNQSCGCGKLVQRSGAGCRKYGVLCGSHLRGANQPTCATSFALWTGSCLAKLFVRPARSRRFLAEERALRNLSGRNRSFPLAIAISPEDIGNHISHPVRGLPLP
jgi:hypothetical protein